MMASLHSSKGSPFWYCAYRGTNGERRFRSTREKDRARAELICKAWAEAEQVTPKGFLSFNSSSNSNNSPPQVYFAGSGKQVKIGSAVNPPRRVASTHP
jgi:hypothetical protein